MQNRDEKKHCYYLVGRVHTLQITFLSTWGGSKFIYRDRKVSFYLAPVVVRDLFVFMEIFLYYLLCVVSLLLLFVFVFIVIDLQRLPSLHSTPKDSIHHKLCVCV